MKDYTHITLLVDRSGSMAQVAAESSQAINKFVEDQAAVPGKLTVSLYQFDDQFETVTALASAAEWQPYSLEARGWTALLDSMAQAIDDTGAKLRALPKAERPDRVFFVVVTDGAENASKRFNRQHVSQRVRTQTDDFSWEFVFLGANLDAFGEAGSLGIGTAYKYNPVFTAATYSGLSQTITATRSAGAAFNSDAVAQAMQDAGATATV